MDPNSTPPGSGSPEQPSGGTPPNYTPPQGYTPPPQQGYAPPPQGYAPPPQQGYPPPQQQGYPPQQQGYPPQQGYTPPPQGYPPPGFQQPYAQMQAPVVKKSGIPTVVWVLGIILVVIVVICGGAALAVNMLANSAGNALKDAGNTFGAGLTVTAFDLSLTTGDYETAHSYLGGDLAKRYTTAQLQQKWEALGGSSTVNTHFGSPVTNNGKTTVTWTVVPPGKSAVDIVLTMDDANNDWKIISANPDLIPNP